MPLHRLTRSPTPKKTPDEAMSGLVSSNPDNANPTVHKTAADRGAGKGSSSRLGAFLDEDELELTFSEREGDDNADDESSGTSDDGADPRARRAKRTESPDEPIDAYEIYGAPTARSRSSRLRLSFVSFRRLDMII